MEPPRVSKRASWVECGSARLRGAAPAAVGRRITTGLVRAVVGVGGIQGKRGDFGLECLAAGQNHLVLAAHEAGGRGQRDSARIFEGFAGLQHRLLAYYAGAADVL